jgi:spermidine synthase
MQGAPLLPGFRTLARTATRDCPVALHRRGRHYAITSCGRILMSNDDTGSERALGRIAARLLRRFARPRILVGGLGMGFTLRALLDRLPRLARVIVAELLPAVAEWNRRHLGQFAARPIEDRRVRLWIGDVAALVRGGRAWDAIVLDVDNGPEWLVQRRNNRLYGRDGITRLMASLRPGGVLIVWSADRHIPFERRLAAMGLRAQRLRSRIEAGSIGPVIYVVSRTIA